jgi:hypothetical protein
MDNTQEYQPAIGKKVSVWIVFNVFFGGLSLGIEWYINSRSVIAPEGARTGLTAYLLRKDLFLICTAIIADAFGNLYLAIGDAKSQLIGKRSFLMCCCFFVGASTIFLFAAPPKDSLIFVIVWCLTFIVGCASKIYS